MAGLAGGAGDPAAFQAGPQVYLLTGAEQTTGVYSNRFAAHIIRQHQFNALCVARGWRNKLRLMVDDAYPPATREMPRGLRAEFWVEGIGENYGTDTTEAEPTCTWPRTRSASTGWKLGRITLTRAAAGTPPVGSGGELAEPLDLEEISPLVFSEIMRDVDLFVGVASVGNDPTWSDGGRRAASGITGRATRSGTLRGRQDAQAGSGAPDPSLEDSGPLPFDEEVSGRRGRRSHVQDPPRQRQHIDGAQRPVLVHRALEWSAGAREQGVPAVRRRWYPGDNLEQGLFYWQKTRRSGTLRSCNRLLDKRIRSARRSPVVRAGQATGSSRNSASRNEKSRAW